MPVGQGTRFSTRECMRVGVPAACLDNYLSVLCEVGAPSWFNWS